MSCVVLPKQIVSFNPADTFGKGLTVISIESLFIHPFESVTSTKYVVSN